MGSKACGHTLNAADPAPVVILLLLCQQVNLSTSGYVVERFALSIVTAGVLKCGLGAGDKSFV